MIKNALALAFKHHAGQKRKYSGVEYVQHVIRVGMEVLQRTNDHVIAAAALLHDTKEDTAITDQEFLDLGVGGEKVLKIVNDLTNPSRNHKDKPRRIRKEIDRDHLKRCSDEVKMIKLIDRMDNLNDMHGAEEDFKLLYARESMDLFNEALAGIYPDLDRNFVHTVDYLMATTSFGINWRINEYRDKDCPTWRANIGRSES